MPKTTEIRANIAAELSVVFANPTQIQQIIMNLGTNAAHAMWHKGGLMTIDVSCTTITEENGPAPDLTPGAYVKLSISDTGMGMAKDVLDKVFDPFFTTKTSGEGTGLGLWVVHSIVRNHKGAVTLTNVPGQGSTFDVFLPRSEGKTRRANRLLPAALQGQGHILIVDDETDIVEMEKIMVERLGYSATAVSDSRAALHLFEQNPSKYDLVLADQAMPGMTGIDLARQLILVRPDIPVILITGYRSMADTAATREAGIKLTVAKPMTRADLGAAIKQLLTNQGH